jgi:hypothetical protein
VVEHSDTTGMEDCSSESTPKGKPVNDFSRQIPEFDGFSERRNFGAGSANFANCLNSGQ